MKHKLTVDFKRKFVPHDWIAKTAFLPKISEKIDYSSFR